MVPPAAVVAGGLADVDVALAVLTDTPADPGPAALYAATGASQAPPATAHLVVALRTPTPAEILALARGDALHPEFGCRLIIAVEALGAAQSPVTLRLQGPGVDGESELGITGVPAGVFEALVAANAEFPAGVDTFLVAADGKVAGLPRSTRIQIDTQGEG
jgi:alpha-D-ribose 1-methylphosphonate 5-triphosphate synthase subunit PhnH